MRIGIACTNFKASGGMERYVLDLITGLHELGIFPVVFARTFDKNLEQYDWITPITINVKWLPSKLSDYYFSHRLKAEKLKNNIDYLISTARCGCADMAICGGTHKGFLQNMKKNPSFWDQQQIKLETSFYQNATTVIAHSQAMVKELQDFYQVDKEKLRCCYPPINLESFTPLSSLAEKRALRDSLGLPNNRLLFAYPVGGDFYRKGFDLLKKVFSETTLPIELVIVGKKPKSIGPNIRYLGYQKNMRAIYQACDFTIMASLYEPFGLIGPESIASGTRIILSDRVACSEVINPDLCHIFKTNNENSLIHCLADLVAKYDEIPLNPLSHNKENFNALPDRPTKHIQKLISTTGIHSGGF